MSITAQEFKGLSKPKKDTRKMTGPPVKVPQMNKKAKQHLVPYANQRPQRREASPL